MARRSVPFLAFAILAAILLRPLATGKVLLPASTLGRMSPWSAAVDTGASRVHWNALTWDGIAYFYPARVLLSRELGELPFWNPYQMCGVPFLASPQSAVLYPPNRLFAVLPVDLTFGLLAFLHLFAAGSFTYLFLRKIGLGAIAATLGGVAFMLSGWSVVWLELPALLASGVWLPLTLYLVTIAWERRSALHASLAGGTIALSLLGGHPQIWLYGLMAVALYWAYLAIMGRNGGRGNPSSALPATGRESLSEPPPRCGEGWGGVASPSTALGLALLMFAVGFLLAAPQLLPTIELASLSHRGVGAPTAEGYQAYNALSMPVRHLIGLLVPDFYGNSTRGTYWGTGEYAEFCGYIGMLPLLLLPFAFKGKGRRNAAFFAVTGAVALLMATGTDINRLLYFGIPGFSRSGSPARALYLCTFAVAVLGAMGLDRLLDADTRRSVRLSRICLSSAAVLVVGLALFFTNVLFVNRISSVSATDLLASAYAPVMTAIVLLAVGLAIALLAASGRLKPWVVGSLAVGVLAADLLVFGSGYNLYSTRNEVYPGSDAIVKLRELAGDGRIMPMNDEWRLRSFPRAVLPPNTATVYGLLDVQGYDSLYPVRYKRLLDSAAGRDSSPPENGNMVFAREMSSSVCDLLGVRYVVSSEKSKGALELSRGCYAYENRTALPRAFLVHRARLTTDTESLDLVARGEVDLRSEALVYESIPIAQGGHSVSSGVARIRSCTCNRVFIDIDNPDAPGLLVLTDQYYPGWVARIDERPARVIRTDYCFKGVEVPRGRCRVVFSFEPESFRNGLRLASVGILLVLGSAIAYGLRLRGGRA